MDGVKLQGKVYVGLGKAAKVLGRSFEVWRAVNGLLVDQARTVNAQFTLNSTSTSFQTAPKAKDVAFHAMLDGRNVQVGDVLVGAGDLGTYFIFSMLPLLPIAAIRCNARVKITRPRGQSPVEIGDVGYSGDYPRFADSGEDVRFANVPAAIVLEGIGRAAPFGLTPMDSPGPVKWFAYLPGCIAQGDISDRDMVEDQNGERYQVAAAQWAQSGYLLELTQQQS